MPELEHALRSVGRNLDYPATPDLSGRVRQRIQAGDRSRQPLLPRRALVVALAVLAVSVGAVMAVPQARSTVLDWLGVGGVTIRYVEDLPPVDKATDDLGLGSRVGLSEARRRAGFPILLPRIEGLDRPPRVYHRPEARQVAFLYGSEDKPKLLITQAGVGGAIEKLAGMGTDVERVTIGDGKFGVWISGDKHAMFYPAVAEEEPFRLVGNALVFETGTGITVRIEAEVSEEEAIRIASSMR